jgi:hypothetical protein
MRADHDPLVPPTVPGEQLLSMKDDDASRPERLRRKFFDAENVGDFGR